MNAAICIAALAASAAPQGPQVTSIQVPESVEITGVLRTDVDSDGLEDLALACRAKDTGRRELRVHLRRARAAADRSPPDSRITGADSPVIAASLTEATPSTISPSDGIVSPASTRTTSPTFRLVPGISL